MPTVGVIRATGYVSGRLVLLSPSMTPCEAPFPTSRISRFPPLGWTAPRMPLPPLPCPRISSGRAARSSRVCGPQRPRPRRSRFSVCCRASVGDRGWYFADGMWALRGWVDKLIGGVGMRRGRRHPDDLRVGDALDFFRVEVDDSPGLLRLRAEMKLPGQAWLEWRVWRAPEDGGTTVLSQRARFHPRGVAGRLYWWALLAPHSLLWRQMLKRLVRVAEMAHRTQNS